MLGKGRGLLGTGPKSRRILEFVIVLLIIALICGITISILARGIAKAHAAVARQSLAAAEQAIDVATLEGSNVDVALLKHSLSNVRWLEYKGQCLSECKRFWEDRMNSIYFTRLQGGGLCIFAVPTDDFLVYSIYSRGAWHKGEKKGDSPQLPTAVLSRI